MAVTQTGTGGFDLNSLLAGGNMAGILGGTGNDGIGSGLVLGLLLGRSGLWGNQGGLDGRVPATPADVQSTVGFINTVQDINSARRDIFQSQGQIQQAIAQGLQSETVTNLQGQIALLNAINTSTQTTGNSIDGVNANLASEINSLSKQIDTANLSLIQGQAAINQNVNDTKYQLAQTITADGDKTRALIQSIDTANLNRQLVVADNRITELLGDRRSLNDGITVTNNINQNQLQQQQQQQLANIGTNLAILAGEVQRNTQSTINLGTMTGTTQTANNTKVSG
jgi:hypothetical protein